MPPRDLRAFRADAIICCARVREAVRGRTLEDYRRDWQLRSIVERQFPVIGEALRRAAAIDREIERMIGEFRSIIDFRNIVVHGYDVLKEEVVWDIAHDRVPVLLAQLNIIMRRLDPEWKPDLNDV